MKYFLRFRDGEEKVVELGDAGVLLDGEPREVEIARLPGSPLVHLRVGERGRLLMAVRTSRGWRIEMDGRSLELGIEDERRRAIREMAGAPEEGARKRELRAPMPGLVVELLVEPGQGVEAGDGIVIIEAMKMENELRAEDDGVVREIAVEVGQTVNQNDVLVSFE